MKPRLQMQADNRLKDDGSKIGVELKFKSLDDFSPERVVNHIEPLLKLLEARKSLADPRNKMADNDKIGRAHVRTQVHHAHIVSRILLTTKHISNRKDIHTR